MTEAANATPESAKPEKNGKRRFGAGGWFFVVVLFGVLAMPLVAGLAVIMPGPLEQPQTVIIPHGTSIREIAEMLEQKNVIVSSIVFRLGARMLAGDALKAGEYEFPPHSGVADVVFMMREGHSVVRMFTVAEGLTSAEIVDSLESNPALTGKIERLPPEGSLLPETYRYSYGDTRQSLLTRMHKAMQEAITTAWNERDQAAPLKSPLEAVILASIIEKETAKPEERPRVARVFYNRLQHSMRLQSDPTVIYALTQGKKPLGRALTHEDLAFVSPYNTYASDGLPPGPICNPGRASIEAALHPEANDFLYFVADGSGGHVFAKELAQHNHNVTKWNELKAKP